MIQKGACVDDLCKSNWWKNDLLTWPALSCIASNERVKDDDVQGTHTCQKYLTGETMVVVAARVGRNKISPYRYKCATVDSLLHHSGRPTTGTLFPAIFHFLSCVVLTWLDRTRTKAAREHNMSPVNIGDQNENWHYHTQKYICFIDNETEFHLPYTDTGTQAGTYAGKVYFDCLKHFHNHRLTSIF